MFQTTQQTVFTPRSRVGDMVRTSTAREVFLSGGIFVATLALVKLTQVLFYTFNTNPAVIFIPTGIALAAVYLFGYRQTLPIALAWFLGTISSAVPPPLFVSIAAAVAYPLQAAAGTLLLRHFEFQGTMSRSRGVVALVLVAIVGSTIAPTFTTLAWIAAHALPSSAEEVWTRSWAGGVMSVLILTPLITTWFRDHSMGTRRDAVETGILFSVLLVAVYVTFWTQLPSKNVFIVLYGLLTILIWISLRMHPRTVATALFLTVTVGIVGSIVAHPNPIVPLNVQLLADELFTILIAPIFYMMAALVEERRSLASSSLAHAHELEEANQRLAMEDQAKNEFLATLAHELRNPLAPIVSTLELMRTRVMELGRSDIAEYVDIIETHNRTIVRLLDDLLDVSRISRKKFRLQKENVELQTILTSALQTVEPLMRERNHQLQVSLPKERLWLLADPLRLEQVFVNILNNAAKYSDPGGRITLAVFYDPKQGLRISFRDNGRGIEAKMLERIFKPFVQGHVQGSGTSGGLGIGLSLSKRFIELHGGEIWAESRGRNKGSTIVIVLPAALMTPLPLQRVERPRRGVLEMARARTEEIQKISQQILVVDDNRAAADGLCKLLTHGGYHVDVAYDGAGAIAYDGRADVVFLDIGLPDMSGYEVAARLRQIVQKNITLVALTGYGQEEDKARAKEAGFDYHLTKPVGIADVEEILQKIGSQKKQAERVPV
jgi:signal transduction histidine kinase/CheY-like chemotaxis protein